MKRTICILIFLISPRLHAEPEIGLALKGGPVAATLAEDYRVKRYGFSGGLAGYIQWPLSSRFALAGQLELLYIPRGAETIFEGEYLGKTRTHYIDVMMAARPEVRHGRINAYLLFGGGIGYLLSANQENASGAKVSITDELHRVDVALLVGLGAAVQLPPRGLGPFLLGRAFLEGRYEHGLLDTDAVNGGYKNRASSLMLGVSFVLGAVTDRSSAE